MLNLEENGYKGVQALFSFSPNYTLYICVYIAYYIYKSIPRMERQIYICMYIYTIMQYTLYIHIYISPSLACVLAILGRYGPGKSVLVFFQIKIFVFMILIFDSHFSFCAICISPQVRMGPDVDLFCNLDSCTDIYFINIFQHFELTVEPNAHSEIPWALYPVSPNSDILQNYSIYHNQHTDVDAIHRSYSDCLSFTFTHWGMCTCGYVQFYAILSLV